MVGSFFSMRIGQFVLSFGYHFIESAHYERRGKRHKIAKNQYWYVDDVYLFGDSKKHLKSLVRKLNKYMRDNFGLHFKPWKICRNGSGEPADVAGCVVRENRIAVRGKIFLRARRAMFRFRRKTTSLQLAYRVVSYFGWLKNTNSQDFCKDNGIFGLVRIAKRLIGEHDRRLAHAGI